VKSVRAECLDHLFIFNEADLRRARRRMSAISIVGVHIDHLVNARPANQRCFSFGLKRPTAKSPRSLFWADCITFIGVPRSIVAWLNVDEESASHFSDLLNWHLKDQPRGGPALSRDFSTLRLLPNGSADPRQLVDETR